MAESELETDIECWVDHQINKYNSIGFCMVPDFWDEVNTSERLAEYLTSLGYRKVKDG